jgi:hypothetical protein
MLVAIAPQVPGHNPLSFGAGNGAPIPAGIYCVAFDNSCQSNAITKLDPDGYKPPSPVGVSKPAGWDWTTYVKSYVILLPMPDSYSNNGLYPMTFQSSFPTSNGAPPPTTMSGPQSLGLMLHYVNGPQKIGLLTCTGIPSMANCSSGSVTNEDNSGTLAITIKSKEDASHPDQCDYHVHRAYHEMLKLLDPLMQSNADKAYVDVPVYNACSQCDPQQDSLSSTCTAPLMTVAMVSDSLEPVQPELQILVGLIQKLEVGTEAKKNLLLDLDKQSENLKGKFPRVSELHKLKGTLASSKNAAGKLLVSLEDKKSRWEVGRDLQAIVKMEQDLMDSADRWTLLSISGKDCRAPALFVQ